MMGDKTKYLIIILTAVLLSTAASYITTTLITQNIQSNLEQQINQQSSQNTTKTKINFNVRMKIFDIEYSRHYVEIYVNKPVDNFTIFYSYIRLNGTESTRIVDYGSVTPSWDLDEIIYPETVPYLRFAIPNDIVIASSTIIPRNETHVAQWGIGPKVDVLEAYGYA